MSKIQHHFFNFANMWTPLYENIKVGAAVIKAKTK